MSNEAARLAKIIAHDGAMTRIRGSTNRRTWPRFPSGVWGDCRPAATLPADRHWPAEVLNISRAGIGVRVGRRFEPGTPLVMEIQTSTKNDSRLLLARVARARQLANREWELGCILTDELKASDLLALARPDPRIDA